MSILSGFFKALYNEFVSFLGANHIFDILRSGHYEKLLTLDGILAFLSPFIPLLLFFEIIRALVYKKFKIDDYKVPFLIFVCNRLLGRFISIAAISFCIGLLSKYALITTGFTWYWLIYGYIAWELSHFVYHYLAHKVRLFWCLHSSHHAPESMNLSVSYAHFFLEGPYAVVIRTSICLVAGVNPPLLFLIMFIDGFW